MDAALVVSFISLAISLFVVLHRWWADRQAAVTVTWANSSQIVVENHGPGMATKVRVDLGGDAETPGYFIHNHPDITHLPARGYVLLHVMRPFGVPSLPATVCWKDSRERQMRQPLGDPPVPDTGPPPTPTKGAVEGSIADLVDAKIDRHMRDLARQASLNRWRGRP